MIIRAVSDVKSERAEMHGMQGVHVRSMIERADGIPEHLIRVFEVEPQGHTALHYHPGQHLHYILAGEGYIVGRGGERRPIGAGDVVLVTRNEPHMLVNSSERDPLRFFDVVGELGWRAPDAETQ